MSERLRRVWPDSSRRDFVSETEPSLPPPEHDPQWAAIEARLSSFYQRSIVDWSRQFVAAILVREVDAGERAAFTAELLQFIGGRPLVEDAAFFARAVAWDLRNELGIELEERDE